MTNEERDIISQFIARVGGAQQPNQSGARGSVPATRPLPAVDRDADGLITQQFQQYPEARYRITQLAFVQEHALVEAQNRIHRLEWELQQAQQVLQQTQQQAQRPGGGGFFSNLFGGGQRQVPPGGPGGWGRQAGPQGGPYAPPPQPQYPPGYNPGMFQRQGSGFLGSALTTAAGVAGGIVAGNALMSMFSGGHGAASSFGGASEASPWTSPAAVDQGTWDTGAGAIGGGQDNADSGTWDQSNNTDQSWDNSGDSWGGGGGGSEDDTF
jgi:uncharacterized protein